MTIALRSMILASGAVAALAGCASDPAPGGAAIEYRGAGPVAATAAPVIAAPQPVVAAPVPKTRITSSPAVAEAASQATPGEPRPGGALRQPKDDPRARGIEVLRGDSLYDISRRYSVNMRALIETNSLEPPYALSPGQMIYLPPPNIHVVERGENLYAVSRRYNVDTRSLALMNGLARPWTVWPGDEILLPPLARDQGRVAEAPPQVAAVTTPAPRAPTQPPVSVTSSGPISLTPGSAPLKAAPAEPVAQKFAANPGGAHTFIWPVSGPILAGFGTGADGIRNDGVNIGAEAGADVLATAAGEVVYVGDELSGFGNLILIRHEGGWVSAYAHADSLLVKEGDAVAQGQAIARAGATARGAPQVHFELRKGKQPVDPASHLPPLAG